VNQNIYIQNGVLAIFSKIKARLWFLESIRVREILALFFVGVVPILLFSWVMVYTYNKQAKDQLVSNLLSQANSLENLLLTTGYMTDASNEEINTEISRIAGIYNGRILVVDNGLNIIKDTYGIEDGKILISEQVIDCLKGNSSVEQNKPHNYIEMTVPITYNDKDEVVGVLVMSFSTLDIYSITETLTQKASVLFITSAIQAY
jgi:sensor histidine kinase regulating citrate/malate metabolism